MKKKVFLIPVALIAFSILMSSFVVTKLGEFRVIKQFGRVVRVEENDGSSYGLSWKIPFIQSETVISSKRRLSDLPASDVMTSDKKSMISDCFVLWKIEDPMKFIQKLSGSVQNAESRISSNVYNALKNVISSLTQEEVISGRDGELAAILTERLGHCLVIFPANFYTLVSAQFSPRPKKKSALLRGCTVLDEVTCFVMVTYYVLL